MTPLPSGVTDGLSNTIVFSGDSQFDLCADNVNLATIVDGTSNTILLGETVPRSCFSNVSVGAATDLPTPVPEPTTLVTFGFSAAALIARRRKRGLRLGGRPVDHRRP